MTAHDSPTVERPVDPNLRPRCHSGRTGLPLDHPADGWLLAPEGDRRLSAMCRAHADDVIEEYRVKLGEQWRFEPIENDPAYWVRESEVAP